MSCHGTKRLKKSISFYRIMMVHKAYLFDECCVYLRGITVGITYDIIINQLTSWVYTARFSAEFARPHDNLSV